MGLFQDTPPKTSNVCGVPKMTDETMVWPSTPILVNKKAKCLRSQHSICEILYLGVSLSFQDLRGCIIVNDASGTR